MLQIETIGNLGSNAEKRDINGRKCITFDIAHNNRYRDSNGALVEQSPFLSVAA